MQDAVRSGTIPCARCAEPIQRGVNRKYCQPCAKANQREQHARAVAKRKARNYAFVAEVNAHTVCAHCGGQPVEWHNPDHVSLNRQNFRISILVTHVGIEAIRAEMARCTPLCRRCHMQEDGRMQRFLVIGESVRLPKGTVLPPKPCSECGRPYKPMRRGLCSSCANRLLYPPANPRRRYKKKPSTRPPRECGDCGETKPIMALGRCNACYCRLRYYQPTESGENIGAVKRRLYDAAQRLGRG